MTETKYFTVVEARRTLPLVRNIVKDILETTKEIRLIADDLNGKIEDDPKVKKMVEQVNHFMNELEEIGCFYKDWNFSIGLVDFPAIIEGKDVFLCWKSDEDDIKYYHEMESGFAGRKLIPEEYFSEKNSSN
ncbi:MAG TPA: DUF2203 domain-containing protein [Ignavibacteriaceae bacterium]|nr:DUF2203 domain-containing protein [Ignavibacteriaceae bacterium]